MKEIKRKNDSKPIIPNKIGAFIICAFFAVSLIALGAVSVFDTDKTVSQKENRNLASFPEMSVKTVFDGSFAKGFDEYYADTFPMRDSFLAVNAKLSDFFSKTKSGDDKMIIVEKGDKDDFAGQDITYDE